MLAFCFDKICLRLDTKRLVFGIFESNKIRTGETMAILWRVLVWSLRALYEGRWPATDFRGQPWEAGSAEAALAGTQLAGGYYGVVFLLKGDWEHFSKTFGYPRHNSNAPCWLCRCEKGEQSDQRDWPTNFSRTARWKSALVSPAEWRAENAATMHQLFREFAFLSNANIEVDELHCIHLGTSTYFLGSVLYKLVFEMLPGTPLANMEIVWSEICQEYARQGIEAQYNSLGLGSFCNVQAPSSAYPCLKGRAAEVKWLVPALAAIWQRLQRPENATDRLVGELLEGQLAIQGLLDEDAADFQMDAESAKELVKLVDKWLANYCRVAHKSTARGELLFSVVPKHHALWHFARKAWNLHPRRGACYADEDFMGTCKQLVKGCVNALPLHKVPLAVLRKYRWGMVAQYLRSEQP